MKSEVSTCQVVNNTLMKENRFRCRSEAIGNSVRITRKAYSMMFCEVEVYGTPGTYDSNLCYKILRVCLSVCCLSVALPSRLKK